MAGTNSSQIDGKSQQRSVGARWTRSNAWVETVDRQFINSLNVSISDSYFRISRCRDVSRPYSLHIMYHISGICWPLQNRRRKILRWLIQQEPKFRLSFDPIIGTLTSAIPFVSMHLYAWIDWKFYVCCARTNWLMVLSHFRYTRVAPSRWWIL